MREILFRGKKESTGEWVEGYPVKKADPLLGVMSCFILAQEFDTSCIDGRPTILKSEMTWYKVDPVTVGQYVGLDRNGARIFEGDLVVSRFAKKPYLVCFGEYARTNEYGDDEDCCGWYNKEEDGYVTALGCPEVWATVIGNIHDNPELLKEGGK